MNGRDNRKAMTNKTPGMEAVLELLTLSMFKRSRKDPVCVTCGSAKITLADFRDDLSRKEFEISRMCQECQDKVFK